MANSITLSQSLVDDIAQKLTDGTATAEQVVLYTKGLNQLQTGNDFQSVVIGLSQAAVDTIDSANAQFQEDAQTALNTFSQTADNIDASATNAVSAINAAKDVLVQTDAEISTTISTLPSLQFIRDAIVEDREYIHPYDRPCFWAVSGINQTENNGSIITWYNHRGEQIVNPDWGDSQIYMRTTNNGYDTASDVVKDGLGRHYFRYNAGSTEPFKAYRTSTSQTGYEAGFAKSKNMYGHVMGTWNDKTGVWAGYSGLWSADWMRDNCVIVGETDKSWFLNRSGTTFYVGGTRGILRYNNATANRAKLRDTPTYHTNLFRPYERDYLDPITHEQFQVTDPVSTGYGNVCYNKTLNQMVVMRYNDVVGRQKPLLYTFAEDFNLKDIAKGDQELTFNFDAVTNGKINLSIESTVDNTSGTPGTPNSNEANYRGIPVLCDNGKIVHFRSQGNNVSGSSYAFRWQLNGDGTDYIKDAHFTYSGQTTKYNYDEGPYYGVRHYVSNDGRYVICYDNYYYYHGGCRMLIVRVSDGKVVKWTNNETTWGWGITMIQANKFMLKLEPHHLYSNIYMHDLDYLFEQNADGADINLIGSTSNPALWMPDMGNIQPYTALINMNIDYSDEMKYISPVDKKTDIRTIS